MGKGARRRCEVSTSRSSRENAREARGKERMEGKGRRGCSNADAKDYNGSHGQCVTDV